MLAADQGGEPALVKRLEAAFDLFFFQHPINSLRVAETFPRDGAQLPAFKQAAHEATCARRDEHGVRISDAL